MSQQKTETGCSLQVMTFDLGGGGGTVQVGSDRVEGGLVMVVWQI